MAKANCGGAKISWIATQQLYMNVQLPIYILMLHHMDGLCHVVLKNVEANLALPRKRLI